MTHPLESYVRLRAYKAAKKILRVRKRTMKVLYVGHDRENPADYCPGSILCLSSVNKLHHTNVRVQDTTILRQHSKLPDWLNGTPILIDDENGVAIRGIDAYRHLQSLVATEREHPVVENKPDSASTAPPRMQAIPTRQTASKKEGDMFVAPQQQQPSAQTVDTMGFDDDDAPQDATSHGVDSTMNNDKVTDQDLQRFMQQRNASPASAANPTNVA